MKLKRRDFLLFLGAGAATVALGTYLIQQKKGILSGVGFQPVKGPMPLETNDISVAQQIADFSKYEIADDLVLPEGYTYDIVGAWGEKIGDSRFGYNNDYLSFIETDKDAGYLTINFEYISATPWFQTFDKVIGEKLPIAEIKSQNSTSLRTSSNRPRNWHYFNSQKC